MRQLTSEQKKLLTKTLEVNEPKQPSEIYGRKPIQDVETLPAEVWEKLQEMNDTEILWQEVNRFINDWHWAKITN